MNKISKILIPFNFNVSAVNALNYATSFSEETEGTEIKLLYIILDQERMSKSEIDSKLSGIVDKFNKKYRQLSISYQIKEGEIVSQTLQAKNEFHADLILMGTKGKKEGPEEMSTNTSNLIQKAECPVIVVPKNFTKFKIEQITLAIDKSEIEKPDLLSILLVIARRFDAKIHVLTIYDEEDKDFLNERENRSILDYYFERYFDTSSSIRSSNIAESIIEYDKNKSIDMLAIIPRNHAKAHLPSEGKLTQYLTMRSDIPILTIN